MVITMFPSSSAELVYPSWAVYIIIIFCALGKRKNRIRPEGWAMIYTRFRYTKHTRMAGVHVFSERLRLYYNNIVYRVTFLVS